MKRTSSLLSALLITTTLTMSISPLFLKKAEAVGTINNIIPSSTSVALLQCANRNGAITDALGSVFDGVNNFFSGVGSSNQNGDLATGATTPFAEGSDAVAVANSTGSSIDFDMEGAIYALSGATGAAGGGESANNSTVEAGKTFTQFHQEELAAQNAAAEQAKNRECLKSLGTAALHDLLAASTQDIVNWINTGFEGDPLFIQDTQAFFKGIANQEVYTFVAELNDPVKYPFGAEIGASIAEMYNCDKYTDSDNNCFNNTAVFTLGTDIGEDWRDFYTDFNVGGWGGWLSATQNPANNPIDFQLLATEEIKARIDASQSRLAKEVSDNGGFLSLRKCIAYDDGYSAEDHLDGDYVTTETGGDGTYDASSFNYEYSYLGTIDHCKQYAVTTPGSVIADQLNIHLGASAEAVALGDEVNTSIAAIFDALTNQLIDQGLASLDNQAVITQQSGGFGSNYLGTNEIGSSWYTDPYAPADLHTLLRCVSPVDGTPIPKCKTQIELTEDYLGALYEARDYLDNQLLPTLYLLDKHMPEPDIGWQARMQAELISRTNEINAQKSFDDINKKFIGPTALALAGAANAIPPPAGQIVSAAIIVADLIYNVAFSLFGETDEKVANAKVTAIALLNDRFNLDMKKVQWDIDNNNLPSAFDARIQRDKIPGYEETVTAYATTITVQEQILSILKQIEGDLGPTEATTDGTGGTQGIEYLRATYSKISGQIVDQGTIDEVKANQNLFETDLSSAQTADANILSDLTLVPFGGLDYTVPANLVHFAGEASIIADIAYEVADCTLPEGDQSGFCPVDENESITVNPNNGYHYSYDNGRLQNYNPDADDYYMVEHEWWSFVQNDSISFPNTDYTEDQRRMFAADAAAFLRLYPFGFVTSSPRQNPYSMFYPYPNPAISKSPWEYEKLYQRKEDDACLALKPIGLSYGTCSGTDPQLIYTHLNPTGFNIFDHLNSDDKSIDKEVYLNYFIASYRNPKYGY